jgi:prepilin-type N-terminal cleavage/methylation domain-containing protein
MMIVRSRPGYTLLEVIVAIAIGLLIVAALYVALDVQIRYMHTGRNAIIEAQLARGLLTRISSDVRLSLAMLPTDPSITSNGSSSDGSGTGSGSGAGASGGTGTGAAGNSSSGSGSGATSGGAASGSGNSTASGNSAASSGQNNTPTGQFNFGVSGTDTQITLFVSAVPIYGRDVADQQTGQPVFSDLRVITYYLVPGQGLARQEVRNVAASDMMSSAPAPDLLAAEVVDLQFRYYDGVAQTWMTSWDGTTGGPPMAVEITLGIQAQPEAGTVFSSRKPPTYCRTVVTIPTASVPQSVIDNNLSSQTDSAQSTQGTQTGGSQ